MFVLYGFVARSGATELRHRPVPGFVLVRRNLDTGLCLVLFWYGETLTQACTWFCSSTMKLRHRSVPGFVLVRRNVDTGLYLVFCVFFGEEF